MSRRPLADPSELFLSSLERLDAAAQQGPVVDLACGRGRHARLCAERGLPTVGLDRSAAFLAELREATRNSAGPLHLIRTDLETSHGIPLKPGCCGAVLVFRFLFRPLAPAISALLRPGGLLVYETFTVKQAALSGGPSDRAFLVEEGELPLLFQDLEVLHFEETLSSTRALAGLVARKK